MALAATSSMVVDLSEDNDTAGALAAASAIHPSSTDSPFERSCDNPECSAPKLISLVPKRETPEFITEPLIMNQPTLINGFTTVFQVDGIAAKMNDIIHGNPDEPQNIQKPQSVFRIVPNTHAHIVNYVVVDGAGETMRKIKANDAETMRKLLDSQRLSAEQMLKKLIGKAFKIPPKQNMPQIPLPIPSKIPGFTSIQYTTANVGPLPAVLSTVPPGITITPLPLQNKQIEKNLSNVSQSPTKMAASNISLISSSSSPISSAADFTTQSALPKTVPPKNNMQTITPSPITSPVISPKSAVGLNEKKISNKDTDNQRKSNRPNILKRKPLITREPETIKKLRSRSPRQKTPMATGLKLTPEVLSTPMRKLPTLPKLSIKASQHSNSLAQTTSQLKKKNMLAAEVTSTEDAEKDLDTIIEGTFELSTTRKNDDVTLTKCKPLIGTASKMNTIKSFTMTKIASSTTTKADNVEKSTSSIPFHIITKKAVIKSPSSSGGNVDTTLITKPCSVSIIKADISSTLAGKLQKDMHKECKVVNLKPIETSTEAISMKLVPTSQVNKDPIPRLLAEEENEEKDPLSIDDVSSKTDEPVAPTLIKTSHGTVNDPSHITSKDTQKSITEASQSAVGPKTRSSTPKIHPILPARSDDSLIKSSTALIKSPDTLSTTPASKDSKNVKVILPVLKSGVMTIPIRSPHPNLKISSVISGGSALAALAADADESLPKKRLRDSSGPDIEKLQQELADLRRTVARLSKKKM